MPTSNSTPKPAALLLGVVFAAKDTSSKPKRGQGFRDRVRCEALEKHGYTVRSLDNKHDDTGLPNHVTANFADPRRMLRSMAAKWGSEKYEHIILDYFFSPVGWARERWTDKFFELTLPLIAQREVLKPGGKIWLPHLDCVDESIDDFRDILSEHYIIGFEDNPKSNPLYLSTEDVEQELLRCPDALTNETQVKPLIAYSSLPFCTLTLRSDFAEPETVSAAKRHKGNVKTSESGIDKNSSAATLGPLAAAASAVTRTIRAPKSVAKKKGKK